MKRYKNCSYFLQALLLWVLLMPAAQNGSAQVKTARETVVRNGKVFYNHKVKQDVPLSALAAAYDVPERIVVLYNESLAVGNRLRKGDKVYVPAVYHQREYFFHPKAKDESLYGIAQRYAISQGRLVGLNPGLEGRESKKFQVRIPVFMDESEKQDTAYYYVVKNDEESLTFIARKFNIRVEALIDANTGIKWYPDVGKKVKIPGYTPGQEGEHQAQEGEKQPSSCEDYQYAGKSFRIAILMPFQLEKNPINDTLKDVSWIGATEKFVEYYQGVLMALEDARKKGLNAEVHIFDTQNTMAQVEKIFKKEAIKDMDLILGPAYTRNFSYAAEKAKALEIPIVAPLSRKQGYLDKNPYAIKLRSSREAAMHQMAQYVARYWQENFIVLHNDTYNERQHLKILRSELIEAFTGNSRIDKIHYEELNCRDNIDDICSVLADSMNNIVLVPSEEEPFVTDIINRLHIQYEYHNIVVFGMPEWKNFTTTNLEYMHELQVHYFDYVELNYSDEYVQGFSDGFYQVYGHEPTEVGLEGYEGMRYLLFLLQTYGADFLPCLTEAAPNYPAAAGFRMVQTDRNSGYTNKASKIIHMRQDYRRVIRGEDEKPDYFSKRSLRELMEKKKEKEEKDKKEKK